MSKRTSAYEVLARFWVVAFILSLTIGIPAVLVGAISLPFLALIALIAVLLFNGIQWIAHRVVFWGLFGETNEYKKFRRSGGDPWLDVGCPAPFNTDSEQLRMTGTEESATQWLCGNCGSEMTDQYRKNLSGRAFLVWLVLIAAEIIHGILRAIFLVPLVGEFRSNQIGVFTGSVIILVVAYLTIRWIGARSRRELLLVGAIWLLATVAFEVGLGRLVMGLPWERITADYNVLEGGLMPLGLVILFFSPMIAARLRKPV